MSDTATSPSMALPPVSTGARKLVRIALALLGVALTAVVAVTHFIDLARFKRTYLPLIEETLDRRIDVTEVHLRILPTPSIRLSHLRMFDSPAATAQSMFFSAEQVQLRLRFWPLLLGRFETSELVLVRPRLNLIKQADGTLNDSNLAGKRGPRRAGLDTRRSEPLGSPRNAAGPRLLPNNVRIRDGRLHLAAKGEPPLTIDGLDVTLENAASGTPFPFHAGFRYPGLKNVSLAGELFYHQEKAVLDLQNNRLRIHDLSLPVEGRVSNVLTAPRLDLHLNGENLDARTVLRILAAFGLAMHDAEASGPMSLSMSLTGPVTQWLAEARGRFSDIKVDGRRAFRGTLGGEVAVRLPAGAGPPAKRLQGTGRLIARDGELTNAGLIRKLERVSGMIGMSKEDRRRARTFDVMEADFTLAGGAAEFTRLLFANPLMEVTGNGTMTIENPVLDLSIRTALSPRASNRAGRGRMTNFFKDSQGRLVVPLKIAGPIEDPAVELNNDSLAENGLPPAAEKRFSSFFRQLFRSR